MNKLTKAQAEALRRAERGTFSDNSGIGAVAFNGLDERVFCNLAAKGLVTLPMVFSSLAGAKITPTGRAALTSNQEGNDEA